ncbi:hypothetical protein NEHOM01_0087 [Nematocida homosporus]|uniref:uncharacterized protein n=1 Tax=Nematocida homosporus TaxID=1912981 RepID=UPI00222117AC|nr:uncharacterized protein NEHOM01_0087 [Nematocida homosporus]KAI5184342.1 hypothetical protein NEHOM01_0087 [Nematocida homosporus]
MAPRQRTRRLLSSHAPANPAIKRVKFITVDPRPKPLKPAKATKSPTLTKLTKVTKATKATNPLSQPDTLTHAELTNPAIPARPIQAPPPTSLQTLPFQSAIPSFLKRSLTIWATKEAFAHEMLWWELHAQTQETFIATNAGYVPFRSLESTLANNPAEYSPEHSPACLPPIPHSPQLSPPALTLQERLQLTTPELEVEIPTIPFTQRRCQTRGQPTFTGLRNISANAAQVYHHKKHQAVSDNDLLLLLGELLCNSTD